MNTVRRAAGLKPFLYLTNKSFYIAARYGRKDEAVLLAETLVGMGYTVTSSWVYQVEDEMLYKEGPAAAGRFAEKDLEEIRTANVLVYLAENEYNTWGRGGRHVEFGYALGIGKLVWTIGPMENLFHYLPNVVQFETVEDFLSYMRED